MAITNTTSVNGANAATAAASATSVSNADSEQRFLKLLVTQLNNQDPLNPMENAELTSQLAQMSTVTGIERLNATVAAMASQSGSNQVLQAASLIGYAVLTPGNALVPGKEDVPFAVELPAAASDVTVKISDAKGNLVRTIELGALAEGVNGVKWDGKNDAGDAVAEGSYHYAVTAVNSAGAVEAVALAFSQVAAVKQGASGVTLDLSTGASATLADVRMFL